ncbi:DUF1810 family protein [Oleiharenicola lentus]|uniref:DUF1810 family protein n=1 Tax=Oleiharenicola lentus TaxID=2508720 RepID=UPI003F6793FF
MTELAKFKEAQARDFDTALSEINAGRKTSHWIWYVLPQLSGLGRSETARHYGLKNLAEACDYLRDFLLCEHYVRILRAVSEQLKKGAQLTKLMGGSTDALKLMSSVTLFQDAARRLGDEEPDEIWSQIAQLTETILILAAPQGFERCSYTWAEVTKR